MRITSAKYILTYMYVHMHAHTHTHVHTHTHTHTYAQRLTERERETCSNAQVRRTRCASCIAEFRATTTDLTSATFFVINIYFNFSNPD
jgi:hypothetical protein